MNDPKCMQQLDLLSCIRRMKCSTMHACMHGCRCARMHGACGMHGRRTPPVALCRAERACTCMASAGKPAYLAHHRHDDVSPIRPHAGATPPSGRPVSLQPQRPNAADGAPARSAGGGVVRGRRGSGASHGVSKSPNRDSPLMLRNNRWVHVCVRAGLLGGKGEGHGPSA